MLGSDWSPIRELSRLQRQWDRFFDDRESNLGKGFLEASSFIPSCDVKETEDHFIMSYDLPGVKKEDIKVSLESNELTVSGERKEEREEKRQDRYLSESFSGSFRRSFTLPSVIKPDQVETDFKDGVLRIAVPKTESTKAHTIKVGNGRPGFWDRMLGHKKEEQKKSLEKVA